MKKVAFCFSGQVRTLKQCLPSIRRFILDRIDGDVFAHIGEDGDEDQIKLLNPKKCVIEKQPLFDEKNYESRSGRGIVDVQAILRMLWSMQQANNLKKAEEQARGQKYDWVFRMRCDTFFVTPMENLAELDNSCFYAPTFFNFRGYNDRFNFGGSEVMDVYADKFDLLDQYISEKGVYHPESLLKWAIDRKNIPVRRTDVLFHTLRKTGLITNLEWYMHYGDVEPKVIPANLRLEHTTNLRNCVRGNIPIDVVYRVLPQSLLPVAFSYL